MEGLLATLLGFYLFFIGLPPVVVAARRGLSRRRVWQVAVAAIGFGWTVLGAIWAWAMALDHEDDKVSIEINIDIRS